MENIIKGWFTSILGGIAMVLALYGWWYDQASNLEVIVVGACGFALLYMKDKISEWIASAFRMLMNKFLK